MLIYCLAGKCQGVNAMRGYCGFSEGVKLNTQLQTLTTESQFKVDTLKMQIGEGQKLIKELSDCLEKK